MLLSPRIQRFHFSSLLLSLVSLTLYPHLLIWGPPQISWTRLWPLRQHLYWNPWIARSHRASSMASLRQPTFIMLNLLIHTSLLPSFSSLSSPSFGSFNSLAFLEWPASLVQHNSFWLKHPMHMLRGCPPLVRGRHVWPRAQHRSHGT